VPFVEEPVARRVRRGVGRVAVKRLELLFENLTQMERDFGVLHLLLLRGRRPELTGRTRDGDFKSAVGRSRRKAELRTAAK
jgi:hypothetical protein